MRFEVVTLVFFLVNNIDTCKSLQCLTENGVKACSVDSKACQAMIKDDRLVYRLEVCIPEYHFNREPYRNRIKGCAREPQIDELVCWCPDNLCNSRETILKLYTSNTQEQSPSKSVSHCYATAPWGKISVQCNSAAVGCVSTVNLFTKQVIFHEYPCKDANFFATLPKDQNCIESNRNQALCWCSQELCNGEKNVLLLISQSKSSERKTESCIAQDKFKNRFPHKCSMAVTACVTCSGTDTLYWPEKTCWDKLDNRMTEPGCGYIDREFCCWCQGDNCNTKENIDQIFSHYESNQLIKSEIQCFVKTYGKEKPTLERCQGNACQVCHTGIEFNWDPEAVCVKKEQPTSNCSILNDRVCCWCHEDGCNHEAWVHNMYRNFAITKKETKVGICTNIVKNFWFEQTQKCNGQTSVCQSCFDRSHGRFYGENPCISTNRWTLQPYYRAQTGCAEFGVKICCWCDSNVCNTEITMQKMLKSHGPRTIYPPVTQPSYPFPLLPPPTQTSLPTPQFTKRVINHCAGEANGQLFRDICQQSSTACQSCLDKSVDRFQSKNPCISIDNFDNPPYNNQSIGCANIGPDICCWCSSDSCNTETNINKIFAKHCNSVDRGNDVSNDGIFFPEPYMPPFLKPQPIQPWSQIPQPGPPWLGGWRGPTQPYLPIQRPIRPRQPNFRQNFWNQPPHTQDNQWQPRNQWNREPWQQAPRKTNSFNSFWGDWFPPTRRNSRLPWLSQQQKTPLPTENGNWNPPTRRNSRLPWLSQQQKPPLPTENGNWNQRRPEKQWPRPYDQEIITEKKSRKKRETKQHVHLCWTTTTNGTQKLQQCPPDTSGCQAHVINGKVIQTPKPCLSIKTMWNSTVYKSRQGCADIEGQLLCWCSTSACNNFDFILQLHDNRSLTINHKGPLNCWGTNQRLITCAEQDSGCEVGLHSNGFNWLDDPCIASEQFLSTPYGKESEGCDENVCWCRRNQCNNEAYMQTLLNEKQQLTEPAETMEELRQFSCWNSQTHHSPCPPDSTGCYAEISHDLTLEWPSDTCIPINQQNNLPVSNNCIVQDEKAVCWCTQNLCNNERAMQKLFSDFLNQQQPPEQVIHSPPMGNTIRCWSINNEKNPELVQCGEDANGCMVHVRERFVTLAQSPCILLNPDRQMEESWCHKQEGQLICWCRTDICNTKDHMVTIYNQYFQHVQPLASPPLSDVDECWTQNLPGSMVLYPCDQNEIGCFVMTDLDGQLTWSTDSCLRSLQLPAIPRTQAGCLNYGQGMICWCTQNQCNTEAEMRKLYIDQKPMTMPKENQLPISCWAETAPIQCQNQDSVCVADVVNGQVQCPSNPCRMQEDPSDKLDYCIQKSDGVHECCCTGTECNTPDNIMQILQSCQMPCETENCAPSIRCWARVATSQIPVLKTCLPGAIGCKVSVYDETFQYQEDSCIYNRPGVPTLCVPNRNMGFDCWCVGDACNYELGIQRTFDQCRGQVSNTFIPCNDAQCPDEQRPVVVGSCLTRTQNEELQYSCTNKAVACIVEINGDSINLPDDPCLNENDPWAAQVSNLPESCASDTYGGLDFVCWCQENNCNSIEHMNKVLTSYRKIHGSQNEASDSIFPMAHPMTKPVNCFGVDPTGLTSSILCPETAVGCRVSIVNGQMTWPGMPCLSDDEFTGSRCGSHPDSCFNMDPGEEECWCNDVGGPCNTPDRMNMIYSNFLKQMPFPLEPVVYHCLRLFHRYDVVECHPGAIGCLASVNHWSQIAWPPNPCVYLDKFYYKGRGPNSCYEWQTEPMHYCWCNGDLCNTEPMIRNIFADFVRRVHPFHVLSSFGEVDSCLCQGDNGLDTRTCSAGTVACSVQINNGQPLWSNEPCLTTDIIEQVQPGRLPCIQTQSSTDPLCICQESNCNTEYAMRPIIEAFKTCQSSPEPWCPGQTLTPLPIIAQQTPLTSCLSYDNNNQVYNVQCSSGTAACGAVIINGQISNVQKSACLHKNILQITGTSGCRFNRQNQCVCYCTQNNCNTVLNINTILNKFGCHTYGLAQPKSCYRKLYGSSDLKEIECDSDTVACAVEVQNGKMHWLYEPCVSSNIDLAPFNADKENCAVVDDNDVMCLCFSTNCNIKPKMKSKLNYATKLGNTISRLMDRRPKSCIVNRKDETFHKLCKRTSVGCNVIIEDERILWPTNPCISNHSYEESKRDQIKCNGDENDNMVRYRDSHCSYDDDDKLSCFCLGSNCNKESTFRNLYLETDCFEITTTDTHGMSCLTDPDNTKTGQKCTRDANGCRIIIDEKNDKLMPLGRKTKTNRYPTNPCVEVDSEECSQLEQYTECKCRGTKCNTREKANELLLDNKSTTTTTTTTAYNVLKCWKLRNHDPDKLHLVECSHAIGCVTVLESEDPFAWKAGHYNPCLSRKMMETKYGDIDICYEHDDELHLLCKGNKCNERAHVQTMFKKYCTNIVDGNYKPHGKVKSCMGKNWQFTKCPSGTVGCLTPAVQDRFGFEQRNELNLPRILRNPCLSKKQLQMFQDFSTHTYVKEGCLYMSSTLVVWCTSNRCNIPPKVRELGKQCPSISAVSKQHDFSCAYPQDPKIAFPCTDPLGVACIYSVTYDMYRSKFKLVYSTCVNISFWRPFNNNTRFDSIPPISHHQGCSFKKKLNWPQERDYSPFCWCTKDNCDGFLHKYDNSKAISNALEPLVCHDYNDKHVICPKEYGCLGIPKEFVNKKAKPLGCTPKWMNGTKPGHCKTTNDRRIMEETASNRHSNKPKWFYETKEFCNCNSNFCNRENETGIQCYQQIDRGNNNFETYIIQCPRGTKGCRKKTIGVHNAPCLNCAKQTIAECQKDDLTVRNTCYNDDNKTLFCPKSLCNTECNKPSPDVRIYRRTFVSQQVNFKKIRAKNTLSVDQPTNKQARKTNSGSYINCWQILKHFFILHLYLLIQ